MDALVLNCLDFVSGHHAGEEAVLGVVLEVTTTVGGAVNVVAGAVQAGNVGVQAVVADDLADLGHQVSVEGGGHHVLRSKGGGSQLGLAGAKQRGGQTLGAVLVTGAGGLHALDGHGPVEGVADQGVHLVEGHLIQQLVPLGIVVVQTDHVVQLDTVVLAHGRHKLGLIVSGVIADILQILLEHLGQGQLYGLGGQSAVPVRAVQPGHGLLNALVQVGVSAGQLVGNGGAILAGGVGGGIEGVLGPGVGQVGVAILGHLAAGGCNGVALGGQDVVHSVVGIGGSGEVVVTGVEDVGAGAVGVVGSNVALVDGHADSLGSAGSQLSRFAEADEGDSGLFHTVLLVVVGVRALDVDLHSLLAGGLAGVGDLDIDGVGIVGSVILHIHIAVGKGGVAQAIAEGVSDHVAVGIIASVAAAGNEILIAGLVVFVAYVDALLIDHVAAALGRNIAALDIAFVGGGGEVPHSGGAVVIIAVGIHQTAGGVDLAGQDLGHGVDAGDAHVTDPEGGVDVVLVVLEEIDLQGVGRVDEDDDLFDLTVLLHLGQVGQHVLLVLVQSQVVNLAVGKVGTLTANTGQGDDSGITVLGNAVFHVVGVDVPGSLGGGGTGRSNRAAIVAGIVLSSAGGVEIPQGRVDGNADLFQGSAQGIGAGGINIAGAGAAVDQVRTGGGESADLGIRSQRQRIVVVHQQGCALGLDLLAEDQAVIDHFLGGIKIRGKILSAGVLVLQVPEGAAYESGNRVVELLQIDGKRDRNDHHHGADDCQNLPRRNVLTLGLFVGLFQGLLLHFQIIHYLFLLVLYKTAARCGVFQKNTMRFPGGL